MSFISKSLTLLLTTTVLNSAYSSSINVINNINDLKYNGRSHSTENINHKDNENGVVKKLDYLTKEKKAYRIKDGRFKMVHKSDMDNHQQKKLEEIIVEFKKISKISEEIDVLKNTKSLLGLNELITHTSELERKQRMLKSLKAKTKTLLMKFITEATTKCNINSIITKKSMKKLLENAQIPGNDARSRVKKIKIEDNINRIFNIENLKSINQNNKTRKIKNNILRYFNNKIQRIDTDTNSNDSIFFEESINYFIMQNNCSSKIKQTQEEKKDEIITNIVNNEINEFINDFNDELQKLYQHFIELKKRYLDLFTNGTTYVFKYDSNKIIQHLLNSKHIGQNEVVTFSHKKKWNLSEKTLIGGITNVPNYRLIMKIVNMTWNGNKESPDIKDEYKKEIYYIIENCLVIPCIRDIFNNNINSDNPKYFVKLQNATGGVCKLKVTSEYRNINSLVFRLNFNEKDKELINVLITIFGEDEENYKDNKKNYEFDKKIESRIKEMQLQNSMIIKKYNESLKDKKSTDQIDNLIKLNKVTTYGCDSTEKLTKLKEELAKTEYKSARKKTVKIIDNILENINAEKKIKKVNNKNTVEKNGKYN